MAQKTIQELLKGTHQFNSYESAISAAGVSLTKQNMGAYSFANGDLTFGVNKKAREVHIYCSVGFDVYINSDDDSLKISMGVNDSPFVINNMDVSSLYLTCVSGEVKIQAYYE